MKRKEDEQRSGSQMRDNSPSDAYQELVQKSSNQFRSQLEIKERPRQVVFGLILIAGTGLWSLTRDAGDSPEISGRNAIVGIIFAIVVYCMLQTKDGLMVRPHPIVWRAIHGMFLAYFLLVVFFVSLPPYLGISLVHNMLPGIGGGAEKVLTDHAGKPAPHLLPSDCEINMTNLTRQVFSVWFLAHVGGYWGKMCLFRDWKICMKYSIAFELVELSLVWLVPEFEECWWDSVFMDVLGANMIGMILGRWTLKYLSCRDYDWEPTNRNPPLWTQLKHLAIRFTPFSWSQYHWPEDEKSFILTALAWISSIVMEFNAFIILHGLLIRPSHWIHTARLLLIGAQAAQSVPEWYEYARGGTTRIGHNCWLMFVTIGVELLIGLRYGKGGKSYGQKSPPLDVVIVWSLFFILQSAWWIISYLRSRCGKRRSPVWLIYVRVLAFVPLLTLTRRWVF